MEKQGRQVRGRLVLVPCPLQGHLSPMLELGSILHSKGFLITVAHTKFNFPKPSSHPDFISFLTIPDHLSDHYLISGDTISFLLSINAECKPLLQDSLIKLVQETEDKIVCVIYDTLMYCAGDIASHMKLPSMVFRTNSLTTLFTYSKFPQLHQQGYITVREDLVQDAIPGLQHLRFRDLPMFDCPIEALMELARNSLNVRTSSAVISNTMECLDEPVSELQQQFDVPFLTIGPLLKIAQMPQCSLLEQDSTCISWLDKQSQGSVIYVSLGSLAMINAKELEEMAWGLASSNQPFLWVLRPGSVRGSECIDELLPQGFRECTSERGCIVKWAPQRQVLAHPAVGGFWSHCGWNSTLESLSEGVPLICQPCFGDQKINARYITHVWKVGLELENDLNRAEIARAVKRLMVDSEGKGTRQNAIELKKKIELCTMEGGSSYNSLNKLVELISCN
ncbi:hypothetical protein Tsubulata_011741 [Turnera subulata]|uniref:Glycosyltransferase n=1 Tax=Turnera subulata TaxID=218843 RepID=A0A9Q0GCW5_9ROSI|nr:hypothetical protein Tsubulata_011741 [Turnera subulata]